MTPEAAIPFHRRPKGHKRQRTRAKIIEAAALLVEEKGFEHTTVQDVARRAGVSNGAIYGNFRNRDDIFAAIGPTYWPQVRPQFTPGSSFAEKMRAVADATIAILPERRARGHGRLTGLAYSLTNEALQALVLERSTVFYASAADWWRSLPEDEPLPMPSEILVRLLNVLTEGLTIQWLLTPELITEEVIYAAFAALAADSSVTDFPMPGSPRSASARIWPRSDKVCSSLPPATQRAPRGQRGNPRRRG